ncbi:uncharacterized protein LOC126809839 isoform X2 [Patella vulgata]|uniref:uncharacterized protein LOC126809839 isoform X2 n=1 Tax=Patella vulgata TaxID=6465 RepID=UPI00217FAC68|nr:uncharacterized protein LOC126809839 isoform X2 [Patella vulgata]
MYIMAKSPGNWLIRHASVKSITVTVLVLTLFVNEYLVYWVQSSRWPVFPEVDRQKEMVVLLVSDPQLQGIRDEPGFPVGMVARWDVDRYLSKTFQLAYSYSQPDIVVFLGDLMDEGSKASPDEYQSYFTRFNSIFHSAKKSKLDVSLHTDVPRGTQEKLKEYKSKMNSPFRVIISHETMLPKLKVYIYPIIKEIKPQLLFSGHWHKSMHFVCDSCLSDNADTSHWPVHRRELSDINDYMYLDLTNSQGIQELMIPTCSYRMGVTDIGYGVAIINKEKTVRYTVLWLPRRYDVLYAYIFVVIFLLIFNIFGKLCFPKLLYNYRPYYKYR